MEQGGARPVRHRQLRPADGRRPLRDQDDFDSAVRSNWELWDTCRGLSPVWDRADTLSQVRDLEALRKALGEEKLTFQGSSYGTLLGQRYAERHPGRVRAMHLDGVFDHSLGVRAFVRTQAAALQDAFDTFGTWCSSSPSCVLHGQDVRAIWHEALDRYPDSAFDITLLPLLHLARPDNAGLAQAIPDLRDRPPASRVPPLALAVFCADWPARVRDFDEYAVLVREAARVAPDVRYGAGLLAVRTCPGWPQPVRNPPHDLHVRGPATILLTNARHDPRTGYEWASHVASQLGRRGRLLTYEGAGHGVYPGIPCVEEAVDRYLIDLRLPERGATCPA